LNYRLKQLGSTRDRTGKITNPKKDNSTKDASSKGSAKDKANARAAVFSEIHQAMKGMSESKMALGKELMDKMKSEANGKSRRRKAAAEGKPTKKRKRRTKAKVPNDNYGSDDASSMPDVDPGLCDID
jgi:hypothetical protein